MSQALNALSFPLWGSRLIEASAGTGKTWTIAALYLRLVLGHGGEENGFQRPLLPADILVMTFTRAATRELSDRIRARLVEAARCFRGELPAEKLDPLLQDLLAAERCGFLRIVGIAHARTAGASAFHRGIQLVGGKFQPRQRSAVISAPPADVVQRLVQMHNGEGWQVDQIQILDAQRTAVDGGE